jgi:UDP-glucose:(heptosyl)LPS alpha-1,3-glucosyltransferase
VKFAFCLFKYFPFGGLQRDFLRIARECLDRGHEVDVYTMAWEGQFEPGLTIHVVPSKGLQNHVRAKNFYASIEPRLSAYDVVVGFNKMPGLDIYYAADTCYQAKTRMQRGAWYRLTRRYRHLIAYEEAVFKSSATEILIISPKQKDDFTHYYQTLSKKFHLLPPGIAKDRVAPDNASEIREKMRLELGMKENEFLLLMVGSGFKTKGLDRVLSGYAALPADLKARSKVYIIGKDNPQHFQKQAAKLGIRERIHFLGGRHDVPHFFLAADLLLHPAYNENTGTVLLEALASGLPVLATDICGYAHYITEADAGRVLSSPFNLVEFSQTIASMMLSEQRKTWQENAIKFTTHADIYSLPQRAVDCIEGILMAKTS